MNNAPTKLIVIATALAILAVGAPSFAAEDSTTNKVTIKSDDKGNYDRKTSAEHTDTADTTTSEKSEVKVKADQNGNTTKTVDTETSVDPKGLMNKTTTKSHAKWKKNADGTTTYSHKKKVNGDTVEEESSVSR